MIEQELARNLLEYQCGRVMFCPGCRKSLDAPKAVSVDIYEGERLKATGVRCATCHDRIIAAWQAKAAEMGLRIEISDGRKLWSTRT